METVAPVTGESRVRSDLENFMPKPYPPRSKTLISPVHHPPIRSEGALALSDGRRQQGRSAGRSRLIAAPDLNPLAAAKYNLSASPSPPPLLAAGESPPHQFPDLLLAAGEITPNSKIRMSLNMKTLSQAFAKASAVIEKTVQTTVQEVTGSRPLQDYDLLDQVGSGGLGLAWKLFAARPRASVPSTQYPLVCVWILDKRALFEARLRAGLSKVTEDGFFEIVRADAARLVRIRHPGVVHIVLALDEVRMPWRW